jgi:hypothetical protein
MPSAVAVVAALAALLAFAPVASATSDPLASGTTTLTVKKGFKKKLNRKKIKLLKWGSGKVKNRNVTLAVTGGSLDPTTGEGTTEQGGGFKFRYRKRTVPITELTIDRTGKAAYAKVANARMKLGFLGKYSYAREGFGVNVNAGKLKLTGKAARRINNKLGMKKQKPLKGGDAMSNAYSETQPKTVAVLPTGNATLNLSAAALKKLAHVGTPPYPEGFSPVEVKLSTIEPTTIVSPGPPPTVAFPIGGGTISPLASAGTIQTVGGLKLVQDLESLGAGVTTLTMKNIWVDMGTNVATVEVAIENPKNPKANLGNLGRSSIADISLAGATVRSDSTAHTVTVENATATLQAVTAATLNSVFIEGLEKDSEGNPTPFAGQEKFAAGDPLGTVSFTAQTQ